MKTGSLMIFVHFFFFAVKRHKMTMTSYELLDGPTKTRATRPNWGVYDIGSTLTMNK